MLVRNPNGKAEWTFGSIIHGLIYRFSNESFENISDCLGRESYELQGHIAA